MVLKVTLLTMYWNLRRRDDLGNHVRRDDLQLAIVDRRGRAVAGRALRIIGDDVRRAVIEPGGKVHVVMAGAAGLRRRHRLSSWPPRVAAGRFCDMAGRAVARVLRVEQRY